MKEFVQRDRQADLVDAQRALEHDTGRSHDDTTRLLVEALHRMGEDLPLELARARSEAPQKYREALSAMDLGVLGTRGFDAQIALLGASPDLDIAAELRRRRAQAESLHAGLRARAERSLGVGLGHVQVFRGPAADAATAQVGAEAFAHGSSIVLGNRIANAPSAVMAEEVAHVAQQAGAAPAAPTVTPASSRVESSARAAAPSILAGRQTRVGSVGRHAIMRVERNSVREEDRNAQDLSPQYGSMESRSDEELDAIVNDERGEPRYQRRGYLFEPQNPGAVTLELWLAAYDEVEKRNTGPRGKEDDRDTGEAHAAQGEVYAADEAGPVQRKGRGPAPRGLRPARVAASGFRGGGQPLPYLTRLQRSFGRHDLATVRAYVGPSAVLAARRLRANAYAMGEQVAFRGTPDLHTAAHEAAHVVQQRRGVSVPGGVSAVDDVYERHANQVAAGVVAGMSVEHLLEHLPGGTMRRAIQRDPDRDDEDWTPREDVAPGDRYVLHGSTRRFAALLHIYQSGDFGSGGLTGDTVVTENGLTLAELYRAYREDRITCTNSDLDILGATSLVHRIRANGWVDNDARAEELGLPMGEGGNDDPRSYRPLNLEEAGSHDIEGSIDERLSSGNQERSGLRTFIQQGPPEQREPEARPVRRARREREVRMRDLQHRGDGEWANPDGSPLSDEQRAQLRSDLPESARGTGVLRGRALEDYRRFLEDENNPPLSPTDWSRRRRAESGGDDNSGGAGGGPTPAAGGSRRGPGGTRTLDQQQADGQVDPSTPPSLTERQLRLPTERDRLDEEHERVVRPGDREELERRIRARRREGSERNERVARPGDREELERQVRRARGEDVDEPATTPHPQTDPSTPPRLPREQVDHRPRRAPSTSASLDQEGGDIEFEQDGPSGERTTTAAGHARVRRGGGSVGGTAGSARTGRSGRVMGGLDEVEGGGSRASGSGRFQWRTRGGQDANVEGSVEEERGPDGELRGRSARLGGGAGRGSLAVGAGYRCFAERAHQDPANPRRFTVDWTISITQEFAAEYRIGVSASRELERTGTEVFVADSDNVDDIRDAEREAETWRQDFANRGSDEVAELFRSGSAEFQDGIDFWRTSPVGTRRQIASQAAISASLEVPIFGLFSVGGSYEGRWRDTARIEKKDDQNVEVTQIAEVRDGASASGGTFGSALTAGGRVIDTVTVVTRANLQTGEAAITRLIEDGHDLDTDQSGVSLVRATRDQGTESTSSSGFGTAGVTDEGGVSHETGVEVGPDGERREVDIYHGRHETDASLAGDNRTTRFRVDAPVSGDGNYVVSQRISASLTAGGRDELARATGRRRDGGGGNSLSGGGEWTVTEEFTRAQIDRFIGNFMARWERTHGPDGLNTDLENSDGGSIAGVEFGGGAYGHLYHQLRSAGDNESARARAIAEFLEAEGQGGVRAIRHYAGGSAGQAVTFTDREGRQDENLMSLQERRALDTSLREWEQQVDDLATTRANPGFGTGVGDYEGAEGLRSAGDVDTLRQQVERQLTRMRERRDALDDQRRYGGLPTSLRQDLVRDYDGYITRMETLLPRLNTAGDRRTAAQYSTEAQAEFERMQAARDTANDAQGEVELTRRFSIDHRRYFGQEPSELQQAEIGPRADARTRALWSQAEANRDAAVEAMRIARLAEEESRDRPSTGDARFEGTMLANWSNARENFERATEAYREAQARYAELNQLYTQLREHERPVGEEDPNPDGTAAAPPEEDVPATSAEGGTTPTTQESEAESSRGRRRRRRRRSRGSARSQPSSESAGDTNGAERRQLVPMRIRYDEAGRHIHITGISSAHVDDGTIEATGGVGLQLRGARLFALADTNQRLMDRLRAAYGDGSLYHATYEIVREAPGIASFQVGTSGIAINEEGETFDSYAWVAGGQERPIVQHKRRGPGAASGAGARAVAARGVAGSGSTLPHAAKIQRSFGRFDISGVRAHVGGAARKASDAMGATAFAAGEDVAFRSSPTLHTAAHEAAHVVQQRAGVTLQGGVGKVGDTYERQADKVADAVVSGRSAESILSRGPGGRRSTSSVQRKAAPKYRSRVVNAIQKRSALNSRHQQTQQDYDVLRREMENALGRGTNTQQGRQNQQTYDNLFQTAAQFAPALRTAIRGIAGQQIPIRGAAGDRRQSLNSYIGVVAQTSQGLAGQNIADIVHTNLADQGQAAQTRARQHMQGGGDVFGAFQGRWRGTWVGRNVQNGQVQGSQSIGSGDNVYDHDWQRTTGSANAGDNIQVQPVEMGAYDPNAPARTAGQGTQTSSADAAINAVDSSTGRIVGAVGVQRQGRQGATQGKAQRPHVGYFIDAHTLLWIAHEGGTLYSCFFEHTTNQQPPRYLIMGVQFRWDGRAVNVSQLMGTEYNRPPQRRQGPVQGR